MQALLLLQCSLRLLCGSDMYDLELENVSYNEVKNLSIQEIREKIQAVEYQVDLLKLKVNRYCNKHDIDPESKVADHPYVIELTEDMEKLMIIMLGYVKAIVHKSKQ